MRLGTTLVCEKRNPHTMNTNGASFCLCPLWGLADEIYESTLRVSTTLAGLIDLPGLW